VCSCSRQAIGRLDNGELIIRFEYRPATIRDWPEADRAGKTKPPAQKDLMGLAEKIILATGGTDLTPWLAELGKMHVKTDGEKADYTRLRAHLNRYAARNTFDYFIHKDLGGFLRRELDFYIKNEVMHLDDIENESAPASSSTSPRSRSSAASLAKSSTSSRNWKTSRRSCG
jgi:adenine-specific DNA-methyltransferase